MHATSREIDIYRSRASGFLSQHVAKYCEDASSSIVRRKYKQIFKNIQKEVFDFGNINIILTKL